MSLIGRSDEYRQGYEDSADRAAPIIEARERDMYEAMRERDEAREQLRGAVEAERARVVAYVRGRGSDCWDPGVEAALRQVAAEIERDHHHGGR